jgi:hypothetical protein
LWQRSSRSPSGVTSRHRSSERGQRGAKAHAWSHGTLSTTEPRIAGSSSPCGLSSRGIDRSKPDAVLNLLAITFEERDPPSGTITLFFAEGGAIQVDVECVEMQMKDLGPVWQAEGRPVHDFDLVPAAGRA